MAMLGGGGLLALLFLIICCFAYYCRQKQKHSEVVEQRGKEDSVEAESSEISVKDTKDSSNLPYNKEIRLEDISEESADLDESASPMNDSDTTAKRRKNKEGDEHEDIS